jgi:hypothetical protein
MAKVKKAPKRPAGSRRVSGREAETALIVEAARIRKAQYAADPEAARAKLVELGILDKSGRLTKNYR